MEDQRSGKEDKMYKDHDSGNNRGKEQHKSGSDQPESSWRRRNSSQNSKEEIRIIKGRSSLIKRRCSATTTASLDTLQISVTARKRMMMKLILLKVIVLILILWFS